MGIRCPLTQGHKTLHFGHVGRPVPETRRPPTRRIQQSQRAFTNAFHIAGTIDFPVPRARRLIAVPAALLPRGAMPPPLSELSLGGSRPGPGPIHPPVRCHHDAFRLRKHRLQRCPSGSNPPLRPPSPSRFPSPPCQSPYRHRARQRLTSPHAVGTTATLTIWGTHISTFASFASRTLSRHGTAPRSIVRSSLLSRPSTRPTWFHPGLVHRLRKRNVHGSLPAVSVELLSRVWPAAFIKRPAGWFTRVPLSTLTPLSITEPSDPKTAP